MADGLAPAEIPSFLGELERLRGSLWARLVSGAQRPETPQAPPVTEAKPARLLTAAEAGQRLGKSKWWVYQHKAELPVVPLPGGRYGFSEAGLERWIQRRSTS